MASVKTGSWTSPRSTAITQHAAYLLGKLKNTPEGDSNLLENSVYHLRIPMGDSNLHNHKRVPLVVMGHAGGKLTGGVHQGSMARRWPTRCSAHCTRWDGPISRVSATAAVFDLNTNPVVATDAKDRSGKRNRPACRPGRTRVHPHVWSRHAKNADDWSFNLRDGRAEPDADPRGAPVRPRSQRRERQPRRCAPAQDGADVSTTQADGMTALH
jgi:hypothetical protein